MELRGKNILVTGANGLVGNPTVRKCLEAGANKVYAVDLRFSKELQQWAIDCSGQLQLVETDLTYLENCERLFQTAMGRWAQDKIHVVLHIAGIKGSPSRTAKSPADYLFPMMMFNTNMMKASFDAQVEWFVYLSSVGVYSPADVMYEDSVWETMPSKNDWHPGWSKRMGELALDALKIQHGWDNWTILRPSNIYGPNDNFSPDATVISSNIWKLTGTNSEDMICWGDGSSKRDFVFSEDVADATIDAVKNEVRDVVNFGCGEAVSIKDTIETIVSEYQSITGNRKNIIWDSSKPNGDKLRCLSTERQQKYNLLPTTSLRDGIRKTLQIFLGPSPK